MEITITITIVIISLLFVGLWRAAVYVGNLEQKVPGNQNVQNPPPASVQNSLQPQESGTAD